MMWHMHIMTVPRSVFCLPYMPLNQNPSQSVQGFPCKRDIVVLTRGSAGDTIHIVILVAHSNLRLFDFHRRAAGWGEGKEEERKRRDVRERLEPQTKSDLRCSPLLFVPRMIFDAEVDHREGKHHAGCGQCPCREEDVHVSVITPVSKSSVEFGSRVMWETHGNPTASARHTPAEPEDWRDLSG